VLIFKTISEQEDDVKIDFKQIGDDVTLQKAAGELMAEKK